ncbi:MAG TPA: DUF4251 domain-containing protein [Chitinophagales bacterium]|nr:DUF4251 domain-containing protein [Chitinophagales bacterium]
MTGKVFTLKIFIALTFAGLFTTTPTVQAQDSKKDKQAARSQAVQKKVMNREYLVEIQSVIPSGGRMRQLSPGYSLQVKTDSIICNLPYFGEAHSPAVGSGGGYNFIATQFDYSSEPAKKGGWEIHIKTKDQQENPDIYLTIFENGSASIRINSMSRESISYSGTLAE